MKKNLILLGGLLFAVILMPFLALAEEAVKAAAEVAAPVVAAAASVAADLPPQDFLTQVFEAVKGFGGLSWGMKVIVICTLLVSSMKVSLVRMWVWDKLGALKVLVAPALALIAGLVQLKLDGSMSLAGITAWVMAGMGAIILHELLDAIKDLPMVGEKWDKVIEFIQGLLKGKKSA